MGALRTELQGIYLNVQVCLQAVMKRIQRYSSCNLFRKAISHVWNITGKTVVTVDISDFNARLECFQSHYNRIPMIESLAETR